MARIVPKITYDYAVDKLMSFYKSAFKSIWGILSSMIDIPLFSFYQQQSYLRQIEFILGELDQNNKEWVNEFITQAYHQGIAVTEYALGEYKSLTEATKGVSYSLYNRQRLEAHVADTYDDLLQATKNTEKRVKDLVKQVVSKTIRSKAIQQMGRRAISNEIVNKLVEAGLSKSLKEDGWVGIVDKAGRRWNLSTYAQMVARTKLQQAQIEGTRNQAAARGVDMAIISRHNAADACRQFEGMVISLSGSTPGLLTYEELRQSNLIFHPNCQHSVSPIRDIKLLPKELQTLHEEKMKNAYKILQQGR